MEEVVQGQDSRQGFQILNLFPYDEFQLHQIHAKVIFTNVIGANLFVSMLPCCNTPKPWVAPLAFCIVGNPSMCQYTCLLFCNFWYNGMKVIEFLKSLFFGNQFFKNLNNFFTIGLLYKNYEIKPTLIAIAMVCVTSQEL